MPQMNLDILAVVADEQASPQLSSKWFTERRMLSHLFLVHPHPNRDDGLAFNFFRSPLSSETVQFDMSVDGKIFNKFIFQTSHYSTQISPNIPTITHSIFP